PSSRFATLYEQISRSYNLPVAEQAEQKPGFSNNLPIVILSPASPSGAQTEDLKRFGNIYLVEGSPLSRADLARVRIHTARSGIVLANREESLSAAADASKNASLASSDTSATATADAPALLSVLNIEALTYTNDDFFLSVEFIHRENMQFVGDTETIRINEVYAQAFLRPSFMAGRVYAPVMLDTLICQAYYNEFIPDLMQRLIFSHGNVVHALGTAKLQAAGIEGLVYEEGQGVEDSGHVFQVSVPERFYGRTYASLFAHCCFKHAAVPIGLYRTVTYHRQPLWYVMPNPSPKSILREDDRVYGFFTYLGRSREEEERRVNKELANIRTKFKDNSLNGYNRKKYVCKLVYMSLLGYDVNFGHREAVELINSSKYSEKQVGYLAVTLVVPEESDFLRMVVGAMRRDIHDTNEFNVCLALNAIANLGAREIASALTPDIFMQLVSSASSVFAKKKAALCLLRLLRRHPDAVNSHEWATRVIPYMGHRDIGVTMSVTSLVTALAQQYPDEMRKAGAFAVRRLKSLVIDNSYSTDYMYYNVPVPWLQIKFLRLLQYFPAPENPELRMQLLDILRHIIDVSQEPQRDLQQMNAQYSILFEAINLGIELDIDQGLMQECAVLLGKFITSRETNVRYLGLETMAHLAAYIENLDAVKTYQGVIIQSLRDRDVSVRRRALDLLYSMCDVSNAKMIVSELLRHMAVADFALREEMALKVAILTEKYATEYSWYVDVMMRLLSLAGDHMGDEVWHRVVQ
ncbi:hypothetical protein EC988_004872, partial [Linderina pennispora]